MKKKWLLCLLSAACILVSGFAFSACTEESKPYHGSWYVNSASSSAVVTIDKNGVTMLDTYFDDYKVDGNKLIINDIDTGYRFYENYDVLCDETIINFDTGKIPGRDGYFSADLYNFSYDGGVLIAYKFYQDGKVEYLNVNNPLRNASGTYHLKNGVLDLDMMTSLGTDADFSYNYITETGILYTDVFLRGGESYFDDFDTSDTSSENKNNENSSTETPTYTLDYSVNNTAYGYIAGNTTQTVDENEDGTSVTAVANDGYKFVGWSDGVSTATRQDINVVSNITVTANFEPIKLYKFTLYDDGIISSIDIQENSIITLDNLTKQGYTFEGWYVNGEIKNGGDIITVTQNITAYAQWTENRYTITYNLNGGQLPSDGVMNSFAIYNLPYTLPIPQGTDTQSFVKWTTDEGGENAITVITELGNYTLYAHYENSAEFLTYKYSEELQGYEVSDYTGNGKAVKIPFTYKDVAVKGIGDSAFRFCSNLTSIEIPDGVTRIGAYAFDGCSSLTSVYITDIEAWCNISFSTDMSNPLSNGAKLYLNNELVTEIEIPDSVTDLRYTFYRCDSLTKVTFSGNIQLTRINCYAFRGCSALTEIVIPDSVKGIDEGAFDDCSSLTSIVIPESVEWINSHRTFDGCTNLKTIVIDSSYVANGTGPDGYITTSLSDFLQYAMDVYIRADITVTATIYDVLYDNKGIVELDGEEYYHYQIKGE